MPTLMYVFSVRSSLQVSTPK